MTTISTLDSTSIQHIQERLLDSEEYAGEAAIPHVAEDAADVIQRLEASLKATQVALSQAMRHSEKANKFTERIAGLSIWDYHKGDGTSLQECEQPSDGHWDSHLSLMEIIKEARSLAHRAS